MDELSFIFLEDARKVLTRIYELLGSAVLIIIPLKEKGPKSKGWQQLTFEQTQTPEYQDQLLATIQRGGNIGVVVGPASGVAAIDIDLDSEMETFLHLNPAFAESFCTRGAVGCQLWCRPVGDYPATLIHSKKKIPGRNKRVAEARFGGGHQSVIWGLHPCGDRYQWLSEAKPIEIRFENIRWPNDWGMEFDRGTRPGEQGRPLPDPIVLGEIDAKQLAWIERRIQNFAPAISGEGGHDTTFAFAMHLAQECPELSEDQLFACLAKYNARCNPPWSEKELRHKAKQAITESAKARVKQTAENASQEAQQKSHPEVLDATPDFGLSRPFYYREIEVNDLLLCLDDEEPLPPFPLDGLPKTFRAPIEEVMRHYRVPALIPATCALIINSAALGRGIVVKSNVRRTYANLYALVGAKSGTGKTVVFDEFMAPLGHLQSEMLANFKAEEKPRAEAELKLVQAEVQRLLKIKGNHREFDLAEDARHERLSELLQRQAELEDKLEAAVRLWCVDFTSEALGVLLANSNEQIAVLSDEGGLALYNMLGRYTKGLVTDDILLCKAKSVNGTTVDRLSRPPIILRQPCVALLLLVQPDLLRMAFSNERLLVGGFLARCLCADSRMQIQYEDESTLPEVNPGIMEAWNQHIRALVENFRSAEDPYWINTQEEVRALSRKFHNENVDQIRGALFDIDSFAMRWVERAWEIALNLHAGLHGVECYRQPLSKETFANAVLISSYFAERQLEVLNATRVKAVNASRDQLYEILECNGKNPVTVRDLKRRHGMERQEVLNSVKSHPELFGIAELRRPTGGPPSLVVFIKSNPPSRMKAKLLQE